MVKKTFKIGNTIFKFKKLSGEELHYNTAVTKKILSRGEDRIIVEADLHIRRVDNRIEKISPYALLIENPHKEDIENSLIELIKKAEEESGLVMLTLTDLTFFGLNPPWHKRISNSIKKLMPKEYKFGTLSHTSGTELRKHYPVKTIGVNEVDYHDISVFTSGKVVALFKKVEKSIKNVSTMEVKSSYQKLRKPVTQKVSEEA